MQQVFERCSSIYSENSDNVVSHPISDLELEMKYVIYIIYIYVYVYACVVVLNAFCVRLIGHHKLYIKCKFYLSRDIKPWLQTKMVSLKFENIK